MSAGGSRLSALFSRAPRSLVSAAGLATTRFPVATVLILAFALVANLEVAEIGLFPDWPRALSVLSGAAAASVAVRVGAERRLGVSSIWRILLPVLAAVFVGAVLWFGEPLSLYAPALLPAAVFAVPLAPFVGRGTGRQFWTFTLWTSVGVVLAFLSVLLFCAGLVAILEMIRFLFHVGPGSRAYEHILITALTLVGPLFALGRVPPIDDEELVFRKDDRLVASVRPLFDWVAAPLVLATALVLHLYALRILVTGEVPRGEIGWIVTFFSILVLGLRIAIDPFLTMGARPARLFGRLWAPMLVVPLLLLAYAAWLRIGAHGFSVERYYLVLGGLAALLAVLVQAWRPLRGDIRVIAGIPTVLLALSVAGPWSAADVVGRSQIARIADGFLNEAGSLDLERRSRDFRWSLRSRIAELGEVRQLRRLGPFIPQDREEARELALGPRGEDRAAALLDALGIRVPSARFESVRSFNAVSGREMNVRGFDVAAFWRSIGPVPGRDDSAALSLHFDGASLVLLYRGTPDRVDLSGPIASLPGSIFEARGSIEPPVFDLESANGRRLRLRLEALTVDADALPVSGIVTLLLRSRDWPQDSLRGR